MAHLLIPPQRSETLTGMLWWKKSHLVFQARIPSADQAIGCGISMHRALEAEFANRKRVGSISAIFVCRAESASNAYQSYTSESEGNQRVAKWLLNDIPKFTLSFETPEGEIMRSFDYETVDGKRVVATSKPMNAEQLKNAKERVKEGLRNLIES